MLEVSETARQKLKEYLEERNITSAVRIMVSHIG